LINAKDFVLVRIWCVCVCVFVRESERETETERGRPSHLYFEKNEGIRHSMVRHFINTGIFESTHGFERVGEGISMHRVCHHSFCHLAM
jgi:hypothetical protein